MIGSAMLNQGASGETRACAGRRSAQSATTPDRVRAPGDQGAQVDGGARPRLPGFAVAILIGCAVVQLLLAFHLELVADEAYYWIWSKHPSLSYYDHPPLVAAFIWLGRHVAGDTELGVRLLGAPSLLASSLLLAGAARDLGGGRVAMTCAALFLPLTLGGLATAVIMTPDTPLLLASALTVRVLAAIAAGAPAPTWIAAGAAIGLALLAKYTALALGFGAFVWLIATPRRRALATPWPWLGAATALAVFSPVIVWNAQHGFVSFLKQGGRMGVEIKPSLATFGEFLGGQLVLVTPVLGVFLILALARLTREAVVARADRAVLLSALAAPVLCFFTLYALVAQVEANWTVVALAPAVVATALAMEDRFAAPGVRAWLRVGYGTGAVAILGLILYLLLPIQHGAGRRDITQRLSGHAALADAVAQAAAALGTREVVTSTYTNAALLTFYARNRFHVTSLTGRERYLMMPPVDDTALGAAPVLAAVPHPTHLPAFQLVFQTLAPLGTIERRHRGMPVQTFALYQAEGYRTGYLATWDRMLRQGRP